MVAVGLWHLDTMQLIRGGYAENRLIKSPPYFHKNKAGESVKWLDCPCRFVVISEKTETKVEKKMENKIWGGDN